MELGKSRLVFEQNDVSLGTRHFLRIYFSNAISTILIMPFLFPIVENKGACKFQSDLKI
jgi:hypothetical protein